MTDQAIIEQLLSVLDALPPDKAAAVLVYATHLQEQVQGLEAQSPPADADLDDWDRAVIAAEEYWFGLPEAERYAYTGKVVAVVEGRLLAADTSLAKLQARVRAEFQTRQCST